jgi:hypothetical protein
MRLCSLGTGLSIGIASVSAAQTSITPASLSASALPLRADTLDGYAPVNEPRAWFGFYVYQVAKETVNGKSIYYVTTNYTSKEKGTFQSDTLALDAATLTPLWRRFHAKSDGADVSFAGRHATGWSEQNGKRVSVDHQLSDAAFAGPMLRWMGPGLALSRGAAVMFTTFSIWTNTEDKALLTVTGEESIQLGARHFDTWVLESRSGAKTWIEKSSGRVVQTYAPEGGGRGVWIVLR